MATTTLDLPRLEESIAATTSDVRPPAEGYQNFPIRIMQFGTGNFIRAFFDFFVDAAQRQGLYDGRVAMVQSTGKDKVRKFREQNSLYTLAEKGIEKGQPVQRRSILGAVGETYYAKEDWETLKRLSAEPQLHCFVSNTTEAGLAYEKEIELLNRSPKTFPGKLTALLYHRFQELQGSQALQNPVLVLPCELVSNNGEALKGFLKQHAEDHSLGTPFLEWVEANVCFANTLVDRIVTGQPKQERLQEVFRELGYRDELYTEAEVFRFLAVEGPQNLPKDFPFLKADPGIAVSADISSYKERKLRLLNGAHTITVALAYLSGFDTVVQAMQDRHMRKFVESFMLKEVVPVLNVDRQLAEDFAQDVLDRFSNPHIAHYWLDISLQYTTKMKTRNVPLFRAFYERFEKAPEHMALGLAAFLFFMRPAKEENGTYFGQRGEEYYPIRCDAAPYFAELWETIKPKDVEAVEVFVDKVLKDEELWGEDLSDLGKLPKLVKRHLYNFINYGFRHTHILFQS